MTAAYTPSTMSYETFNITIKPLDNIAEKQMSEIKQEIQKILIAFHEEYNDEESEDAKNPFILQSYIKETLDTAKNHVDILVLSTDLEYEDANNISRENSAIIQSDMYNDDNEHEDANSIGNENSTIIQSDIHNEKNINLLNTNDKIDPASKII